MNSSQTETAPPLFSLACVADPYPTYRRHLRGPALQLINEERRIWGVFRYAPCVALFRDSRLSSRRPAQMLVRVGEAEMPEFEYLIEHMHRWLLLRDPPSHTALRKALNRGFSPSTVERLRPGIELTVSRLLDSLQEGSQIDVVRDIAYPLPVKVISHLLGIPPEKHERCVVLTNELALWFGDIARSPESARLAQSAVQELVEIFKAAIADRKDAGHGRDGAGELLDLLLEIAASDTSISAEELHAQCVMLLFAGHETTRHWVGNAVHLLLEHPAAMEELRANPALIRGAMEEVLRFESPVKLAGRGLTADIEVDGVTASKCDSLLFMVAAAHRDPDQFPDPDRFDIHRTHIRHLAFGGDAHVCLGSTLARLEGQIAIRELIRRFPQMRRARPSVEWVPVTAFRGLRALPVLL
jgi:cytochrome P450